jgi:hypothetical protein
MPVRDAAPTHSPRLDWVDAPAGWRSLDAPPPLRRPAAGSVESATLSDLPDARAELAPPAETLATPSATAVSAAPATPGAAARPPAAAEAPPAASVDPHWLQKRAPGSGVAPQEGQG